MKELAFLDAIAQADLVRSKEVKALEFVDAAIERIEELNPTLNAVITPIYEQARTAAVGKLPGGPFDGVPFLLKDVLASYAGVPMTSGSAFLRDFVPDHDSELVSRFKRSGLIVLGKTNIPELALLATTEPRLFGPTRNPWNTNRTTGGSSGGSAAAVASGMVPMAHANDGSGSLRGPASCCGLFGLKPTRGRNPLGPDYGEFFSGLLAEHVVTHSVRDSAALLDATSGPDVGDPYWAPPPLRPFLQEVGAKTGQLSIAFSTTPIYEVPVHEDCITAVYQAAALCADLGHEVVEAAPKIDGELAYQSFTTLRISGHAWIIDSMALRTGKTPTPDQFEPLTWALYEMGRSYSASSYVSALTTLHSIARDISHFFLDYDMWLTPTYAQPPLPLGSFESLPEDPLHGLSQLVRFSPFLRLSNITGQPAMSIPLYWNSEGLPIGVHFIGQFGNEAGLLRLAAQLEEVRPWKDRHPKISP